MYFAAAAEKVAIDATVFQRSSFDKNIPAFEKFANLEQLPSTGTFVIALPMKIKGGSGGPLHIVAIIPDGN